MICEVYWFTFLTLHETLTMLKSWLALFLPISARFVHALQSFENTAIVRTVELGGAVVHVTTTYAIKSLEDSSTIYTVALGQEERKKTSYIEAKVKGQLQALPIKEHAFDGNKFVLFSAWGDHSYLTNGFLGTIT